MYLNYFQNTLSKKSGQRPQLGGGKLSSNRSVKFSKICNIQYGFKLILEKNQEEHLLDAPPLFPDFHFAETRLLLEPPSAVQPVRQLFLLQ